MGALLDQRRDRTALRLADLGRRLADADTLSLVNDKACVYLTGSFARGEASDHSDLDLFIAGKSEPNGGSLLTRLDEICVKADLIQATRTLGFPEFSGDGEYLVHHSTRDLVKNLGDPNDDADNTFTARLLLLLESRCLLGEAIYHYTVDEVVASYWRDYEDHKDDFAPAFLTNDILRLWRTFCVNYEARTTSDPPEEKAKRKLKNYKLKHSRLLTCYSALVYLLKVFGEKGTVSPQDAKHMASLTPTERLEWILDDASISGVHESVKVLLDSYERFLRTTDDSKAELVKELMKRERSQQLFEQARQFGDRIMEILDFFGDRDNNKLYRLLVV